MSGCVDDEPEPVVLGGLAGRTGVFAVADGEAPLLAVVPLFFHPATIRKPISTNTATPAIQPHIPPVLSSRRTTGSLNRGSGSVKRGSVMGILLGSGRFASPRMKETRQPLPRFRKNIENEGTEKIRRRVSRAARRPRKRRKRRQERPVSWRSATSVLRFGRGHRRLLGQSGRKRCKPRSISSGCAPINSRGLSIRRMQAGGEGMATRKML